jgi:hypothetical protein
MTQGEDTADNGGIHLAFMAREEALARKGQDMDTTEGDGFTPRQRFFPTRISLLEPRGSRQSSVETDRQPQKSQNFENKLPEKFTVDIARVGEYLQRSSANGKSEGLCRASLSRGFYSPTSSGHT